MRFIIHLTIVYRIVAVIATFAAANDGGDLSYEGGKDEGKRKPA